MVFSKKKAALGPRAALMLFGSETRTLGQEEDKGTKLASPRKLGLCVNWTSCIRRRSNGLKRTRQSQRSVSKTRKPPGRKGPRSSSTDSEGDYVDSLRSLSSRRLKYGQFEKGSPSCLGEMKKTANRKERNLGSSLKTTDRV